MEQTSMPPGWPEGAPSTAEEIDAFRESIGTGDRGDHATSEISKAIDAYRAGTLDEDALVTFLDTFKYASAVDPDAPEPGSSDWYLYHQDGGKPYIAGSWDEVSLNESVGLLPGRIYRRVHQMAYDRAVDANRNRRAGR